MKENLYYKIIDEVFKDKSEALKMKLNEKEVKALTLNTLKASKDSLLKELDFVVKESKISSLSYLYDVDNIGKTKAYDLGLIYPQIESATYFSNFIDTNEDMLIVDMCAAPGGKTIDIAIKSQDRALIVANEVNYQRSLNLISNIERLGISNIIITNKKTSDLANDLKAKADIVICDAPCSGMGMARKYKEIIDSFSINDININQNRQKAIVDDAYKLLNKGAYLIYSTCTYTKEENEEIVEYLLTKYQDLSIVPIEGKKDKLFSFLDDTEGQFLAILKKAGDKEIIKYKYLKESDNKQVIDFLKAQIDISDYYLYEYKDNYYISLRPIIDLNFNILRYGILVGELNKNNFIPAHAFYRANALIGHYKKIIDLNDQEYSQYIRGLEIKKEGDNAYYLLRYRGYSLGHAKMTNNILKNKYPKGLRRIK